MKKGKKKLKKTISLLIVFMMLVGMFGGTGVIATPASAAESRAATIPDYIQTTTINGEEYLLFDSGEDMAWLRSHVMNMEDGGAPSAYYCTHNIMLTADIDMANYNETNGVNNGSWSGIGWGQSWIGFSGIFDGNGHTIYNLEVYTDQAVGPKGLLFNITKDSTIKNLVVKGTVTGNRYIGGLVGRTTGSITLENVVVDATLNLVNGNSNAVGGLIGQVGSGQTTGGDTISITNCAAVGTYTSATNSNPVGGMIGHVYGGYAVRISNSYAAADLSCDGGTVAGLIAGQGTGNLQITNSYYLNTMADTSLVVMTANGDASPVGPDSSFVKAEPMTEEYMKSPGFLTDLKGTFKADESTIGGYPVPSTIGAGSMEFIWSGVPALEYSVGDNFDLTGLKIYTSSDDSSAPIDITSYATANKTGPLTLGDNGTEVTVTVTYGGKTETQTYTIAVKALTSLTMTTSPNKTAYYEGELFDPTGMVIQATIGGENTEITDYKVSPDGALTADDTVVTVSYFGKTIEIPITVTPRQLSKIVVTPPQNLIYAANEDIDTTGLLVSAYYEHAPETPVALSAASSNKAGYSISVDRANGTVTVSYTEKGITRTDSFEADFLESNAPAIVDGVCQISNADHMVWLSNQVNALNKSRDAVLLNDIDLTGNTLFQPIGSGTTTNSYSSCFDGQGHTVKLQLYFDEEILYGDYALFSHTRNAEIKNVTVAGSITAEKSSWARYVAGIVAYDFENASTIEGCTNEAEISAPASSTVSGISSLGGTVKNCVNKGSITNTTGSAAGISSLAVEIENCSNYGEINGKTVAAGIGSLGLTGASISNCYNDGTIVGGTHAGGITTVNLTSASQVKEVIIEQVFNTGEVTGGSYAGGILGSASAGGMSISNQSIVIRNAYNAGNIQATEAAGICGGIVGSCSGIGSKYNFPGLASENIVIEISNVYNTGSVTGPTAVGGIVGLDTVTTASYITGAHKIQSAYNTGLVTVTAEDGVAGAIVGKYETISGAEVTREISDVYYLFEDGSDLAAYNAADGLEITVTNTESKTSDELKAQEILTLLGEGFTLTHSEVNDGYPILAWQLENLADDVHDWDEGVVTKEATYTENGEIEYTCQICGATRTEIIDKLTPPPDSPTPPTPPTPPAPPAPPTPSVPSVPPTPSDSDTPPTDEAGTVIEDNTATTTIDNESLSEQLENANASTPVVITAEIPEGEEIDTAVTVLTRSSVGAIAETDASLEVSTPLANIILPNTALWDMSGEDGQEEEQVTITTAVQTNGTRIEVAVDNKVLDEINGGLKVTLPAAGKELTAGSVMVLVNDDGSETVIKKSAMNEDGSFTALLKGSCTVKVVDNAKQFLDVSAGDWYADAVDFASSHELFNGVEDDIFEPESSMTRAMLVTVLHRLEDTPSAAMLEAFDDIDAGTWYTEAVLWANDNGIVNGMGDGTFAPDDNITREQIVVIMYRYANYLGIDVSSRNDMSAFQDTSAISDWATNAMGWAVSTGLIEGEGNGILNPQGNATRAEVATILARFCQTILKA